MSDVTDFLDAVPRRRTDRGTTLSAAVAG
jgi:hypothetical protein